MAGNVGKSSKVLEVDSSNPMSASPKAPSIVSFSKNCGVADDHITNDKTLTLTGTADANSIVEVFDGGKKIGTTLSSKDGSWSSDIGDLADGSTRIHRLRWMPRAMQALHLPQGWFRSSMRRLREKSTPQIDLTDIIEGNVSLVSADLTQDQRTGMS
jgi:hypothetical protein